ncbi:hypothetical protein PPROV_000298700 [Pycnococcus provasolii]|uniref:Anaphase-promoting complex subunit 4 WD40 domain-containing protein n=1 Tax=Pycnococcus provasolii TaxID=41880 RepID=A0A830HCL9_9CHLO|nr:hypothetical protein PPROV_000298700 [Pycnococcus provasolii]
MAQRTLVLGSYERFLMGFDVSPSSSHGQSLALSKTLSLAAHRGAVKCVASASSGGLLASGGTDDTVRIFDIEKGLDMGALSENDATITALRFVESKHLLSASEDGAIMCWKTGGTWEHVRTLRAGGHLKSAAVRGLDVHTRAKVLLSVGGDARLCLWSLKTGRCLYGHRVPFGEATQVSVAPSQECYATLGDGAVVVNAFEGKARQLACASPPSGGRKFHRLAFWANSEALLACDDGSIVLWDYQRSGGGGGGGGKLSQLPDSSVSLRIAKAHESRVKSVVAVSDSTFASVSSDGTLRLWDIRSTGTHLDEARTGARATSLCVVAARHAEMATRDDDGAAEEEAPRGKKLRKA